MNITKFRHACLLLEKDDQSLVVDPGQWSTDFVSPDNVVGVIITHKHDDHFYIEKLREIIEKNPNAEIIAHESIIDQVRDLANNLHPVNVGDSIICSNYNLRFTGGTHATIHPDFPVPTNLGVVIDDGELYYPGDSFVLPNCQVKVLAVPASAPWMKIAEAMEFITNVKPVECFSTHNAVLSKVGQDLADAWLRRAADLVGSKYIVKP